MNQFESETLRLAISLFIVLCIVFGFLRHRLKFWILLPKVVMVTCLGWFVSALLVIVTLRTSFLQGPVFMFAYFAVILTTAPLLAAGVFELTLGLYVSLAAAKHKEPFSGKPHFIAAFSTFACFAAYIVLTAIPK